MNKLKSGLEMRNGSFFFIFLIKNMEWGRAVLGRMGTITRFLGGLVAIYHLLAYLLRSCGIK